MRTRRLLLTTSLVSAWVFAGAAWAAHPEGDRHGMRGHHFEARDTDGDGSISKAEWMASAEARFKALDTNGDGVISKAEWDAGIARMREKWKQDKPEGSY
jgi:hypothetical protein